VNHSESRALVEADQQDYPVQQMASPGSTALILDPRHMQQMMALAEVMARGVATVPRHLQKNQGDCLAVVMQATQWGMNPFAVAQKTHVVSGTLGYEAQLVNAVVNTMAPTKDRINYEWFGDWSKVMGKFEERESKKKVDEDTGKPLKYRVPAWNIKDEADLGVKVWATMKGETVPRVLELLLVQCRVRNSPLWADDPRQQIAYLAVKRWTRLHCPDVLLGVYTPDELDERTPRDMGAAEVVKPAVDEALLQQAEAAADKGVAAYQAFWTATGKDNRKTLDGEHARLKNIAAQADRNRTIDTEPAGTTAAASTAAEPVANAATPAATESAKKADGPVVTFAQVLDAMTKAKTPDALDIAADLIKSVADESHRTELNGKYADLKKGMEL
jgi:hypothetical protein